MIGPTRLEHELNPTNSLCHRHFSCYRYSFCLTLAAAQDWPSFSCKPCIMAENMLQLYPDPDLLEVMPAYQFENERTDYELMIATEQRRSE